MTTKTFKCKCGNIAYYTRHYGWQCMCNNPERYDAAKALKNDMADLMHEQRELENDRLDYDDRGQI